MYLRFLRGLVFLFCCLCVGQAVSEAVAQETVSQKTTEEVVPVTAPAAAVTNNVIQKKSPLDARTLQQRIAYIAELEKSGALSHESADVERAQNLARYPIPVTIEEVPRLIWREWRKLGANILYYLAMAVGVGVFLTLTKDIWSFFVEVFAGLFGFVAELIIEILKRIPIGFYQLLLFCAAGWLMYFVNVPFWVINVKWQMALGCVMFLIVVLWFLDTNFKNQQGDPVPVVAFLCAIAWGWAAILHQDPWIGFFAVLALHVSVGFSAFFGELCTGIGFEGEKELNAAMVLSFVTLIFGIATQSVFETATLRLSPDLGSWETYVAPFKVGLVGMGAFVFYLALEIKSSSHVSEKSHGSWTMAMFVLGPAGAYVGTVLGLPELRAIALVFFILFLTWKIGALALEATGVRFVLLVGSVLVCILAGHIYNHPDDWTILIRVDDAAVKPLPVTAQE